MVVLHFHLARVGAGCATFSAPVSFSFMPYSFFSYPQIILKSLFFIGETRPIEALGTLESLIDKRTAIKIGENDLHARLLATLLDYQEKRDKKCREIEFWIEQDELLSNKYPAVIWSGMLQNNADKAFEMLPELVRSVDSARKVKLIFPWVKSCILQGSEKLTDKLNDVWEKLSKQAREEFDSFFEESPKIVPRCRLVQTIFQNSPHEARL